MAGWPKVLACNQRVTSRRGRSSAYFCRKTPADFDVDAYRKSTGDMDVVKSAAKESRSLPALADALYGSFPTCCRNP
jgi:hypothetical protein